MIEPPTPATESFADAIRLADWIEISLLSGAVPDGNVSQTLAISEISSEPSADDTDAAEQWDSIAQRVEDAFSEIERRAHALSASYPLAIDSNVVSLRDNAERIDVYRFLVLLRARHLYPPMRQQDDNEAGTLFEELVTHAIGLYLGSPLEHRVRFGVADGRRGNGLPLDLPDAVSTLRSWMNEESGSVPTKRGYDYGADAIAWLSFNDGHPGQVVLICQATISENNWMHHGLSPKWTTDDHRSRLINFLAPPVTAVAFVETLSLTPPDRLRGIATTFSSIPFDRLRLLNVVSDQDLPEQLRARMNRWATSVQMNLPD